MLDNMFKKNNYSYILMFLLLSLPQIAMTQTCGFGCLGLSGIFVGYSFENYSADGLNQQLNSDLEKMGINDQRYNFRSGQGFRFGINIVRANFESYFFTVKGYYQFLEEEQVISTLRQQSEENELVSKFEMNHWAMGFDFGIPLVNFLDWKIVDGSIKFYNTQLINQVIVNNTVVEEAKFTTPKISVGYALGSGLVIHIIKDYISIEGTGMYNFTHVDYLTNDDNSNHFPDENSNTDLVNSGGFSGIIQLNIGIPL